MAKTKTKDFALDFAFFNYLRDFYEENRGRIRNHYRSLSKKFLDFNDSSNSNSFLRTPQFEALEMYVFLKEYLDNKQVHQIFEDWYHKKDGFEKRSDLGLSKGEQSTLFSVDIDQYQSVFSRMKKFAQDYPNYIFALTMGTGKTILMATCIFYEFLLANKFPKDKKYCHNALVFAPDKTVLRSLKEIQTFDRSLVIPPEYLNLLNTHLKIHFLEDAGTTLNTIDRSKYNIIISNTQKIILKKQHKEKSKVDQLYGSSSYETGTAYDDISDLYSINQPEDEGELLDNQRFSKLTRLEQLGIYVDEAHHSFGNALAKDMGLKSSKTSLRLTINELAKSLRESGTSVVACYNYTGTPYIGKEVFPEVVYAYGLKDAIEKKYLKNVTVNGYSNPKSREFLNLAVRNFWDKYKDNRYEGMLPKLAIFASTIEELQNDLKPALEEILNDLNIPIDKILVNVGDNKLSTNDDIREFNRLDTPTSDKQFILLVNKGREGWNCRSLFGVALFRKPKSKIFVLQATMRCLRAIGNFQERANVYLSEENMEILEEELEHNFRMSINDLSQNKNQSEEYNIHLVPPPVTIRVNRRKKLYELNEKQLSKDIDFEFDKANLEKYKLVHTEQSGLIAGKVNRKISEDLTEFRDKRTFSSLTLVAEISRYLNRSCVELNNILSNSIQGYKTILEYVNTYNELLYDWIIPKLFNEIYTLESYEKKETKEINLVKKPKEGYYQVNANPKLTVEINDVAFKTFIGKSFHLDTYCFDSTPEKRFFEEIVRLQDIRKVYFTGMLTHGQSDFYIQYIDPNSNTVRSYYPDFLIEKNDGKMLIVEVKGDNKIDDPIVKAKEKAAKEIAIASEMGYRIITGNQVMKGQSKLVLNEDN
ncbi:TnsA endonuclease N-terminal domain-containing protein [Priestia endophytica]|uniref:Type III restriction enzyme, res subunit n=1 Tax=Priestia endophytica DSM 13796 TaxID=1121089 RepID=A0A1I5YPA8_9BACI|nr:TnsA endonuclease N-terminal domain-containing protein [Priestia endophytica]KYG33627.1 type III restriction endonuclease [Priestia endophytica]SFQ46068.1 Type III restriction enzyme, res subunit [Priestia endophytica DSM 13796]